MYLCRDIHMSHRVLLNCNKHINGPSGERIFHSYRQMFCADVHVIFATESFAKIKKTMVKKIINSNKSSDVGSSLDHSM